MRRGRVRDALLEAAGRHSGDTRPPARERKDVSETELHGLRISPEAVWRRDDGGARMRYSEAIAAR